MAKVIAVSFASQKVIRGGIHFGAKDARPRCLKRSAARFTHGVKRLL
jgi:hypothetical protein